MAETNLITITDVQAYRQVDPKFSTIRFSAFCQEIQRKNLRGLLGESLYRAFMADARTTGIYKDLLDGKEYTLSSETITFYGLKPVLAYWWLALAARESELFQSNVGTIQFVNNQQQSFETAKEKERIAVGYMETAQVYANDAITFLNENGSFYPLWKSTIEKNQTQFLSFRI